MASCSHSAASEFNSFVPFLFFFPSLLPPDVGEQCRDAKHYVCSPMLIATQGISVFLCLSDFLQKSIQGNLCRMNKYEVIKRRRARDTDGIFFWRIGTCVRQP